MTRFAWLAVLGLAACVDAPEAGPVNSGLYDQLAGKALIRTQDSGGEERIALNPDGTARASVVVSGQEAYGVDLRWVARGDVVCLIDPTDVEGGEQCATVTISGDRITTREVARDGSVTVIEGRVVPL